MVFGLGLQMKGHINKHGFRLKGASKVAYHV